MKNTYIFFASSVLACSLTGCTGQTAPEKPADHIIRTTVSISGIPMTRATDVTRSEEDNIKDLQIFVFDEKGDKEYYIDAGSASTAEIVTSDGKKYVTAVVNAPDLGSINSRTALLTGTSLLSDNSLGSMVMTGEVEAVLQDGGSLSIPVTRIISKVVIKKVTSAFTSSSNAGKEFRINSIYLINVAGDNTYSASSEPSLWYNKLMDGRNDTACKAFPLLSDPVNKVVPFKSSYTKEHTFFCYPNLISAESFDSVWSPRHTMLVIDARLGGEQTYYPVELPTFGRNKAIIIEELTITRKGSDYPYVPVTDGSCNVTVTVVDWDRTEYTETI